MVSRWLPKCIRCSNRRSRWSTSHVEQLEQLDADIELPDMDPNSKDPLTYVTEQFIVVTAERAGRLDWDLVEELVNRSNGIPEVPLVRA